MFPLRTLLPDALRKLGLASTVARVRLAEKIELASVMPPVSWIWPSSLLPAVSVLIVPVPKAPDAAATSTPLFPLPEPENNFAPPVNVFDVDSVSVPGPVLVREPVAPLAALASLMTPANVVLAVASTLTLPMVSVVVVPGEEPL